jgi:hypothetical protein
MTPPAPPPAQRIDLAAVSEARPVPAFALASAEQPSRAAAAPSRLRFASILAPFAKVAALSKRLFADGTRLAGLAPRRAGAQHAALDADAAQRAAHLARAGPGLD